MVQFGTNQLGLPFQVGTYGLPGNTAQRAAFAEPGHAGLDISFDHRGSNKVTGHFTVHRFETILDEFGNHRVIDLDVSFEQHSEGYPPALFGRFIYQNPVVPEPASIAMTGTGILGLAALARRRSRVNSESATS